MKIILLSVAAFWTPSAAFAPRANVHARRQIVLNAGTTDEFVVGVLGDLHIDPRKMEDYYTGREQWKNIFGSADTPNKALVSLGDLGESKSVRPEETSELFAGTTECHEIAAEYLRSFDVPYEVVGGNHDLEGIDEFDTDEANLEMFLEKHGKDAPQFIREIADKTLLVGMTSTVFRDAKYTSHEVTIDQEQIDWFEQVVKDHPSSEGWKIFVFTHAPPNGSGLRVLQENHVVNGCCWLNHSNEAQCRKFIELVREHRCIKAWFSGHFHLGQDYQDSISFPTIKPEDGPYPNRGSCVFVQTAVMRSGSSRDGRQQSRLIRGNKDGFEICTVDHQKDGEIRLDATITYSDCNHEVGVYAHGDIAGGKDLFKVYSPSAGDSLHPPDPNYIEYADEWIMDNPIDKDTKAWWRMACGRVLGMLNGMLIEYDKSTLAPLGLVVGSDELVGKRLAIIDSGADSGYCSVAEVSDEEGMEGSDCADAESQEQAVLLIDDKDNSVVVVQPNEDGSYWRKIVRNKMIRMKEVRREKAAKALAKVLGKDDTEVVSTYGPYTSTAGMAKNVVGGSKLKR
mmetsp:Transcript_29330/g.84300  ORF Transcript_29330/g.84300 Transcript_29330/m.84300 type:complete len:567 (-) Transcript_29330:87-1787(-)|eukprot:CAMPEP_0176062378 /NCGR_PEP_ID=MMETSP0120_2-20121206/31105_1 /TAXON_ID=160619 /ORGANISM="Kryptoperidinium foliaceum, Strain CCMP 1326" /LENGTH=566 /DNA_ID=CAMNT_0017395943 /DNA_START=56 /DNA_END=1756 /DNA_ORIENTATION=-